MVRARFDSKLFLTMGLVYIVLSLLFPLWGLIRGRGYVPEWASLMVGVFSVVVGICLKGSPRPRLGRWIVAAGLAWVLLVLLFSALDAARRGEFMFHMSLPSLTGGVGVALIGACLTRRDAQQSGSH